MLKGNSLGDSNMFLLDNIVYPWFNLILLGLFQLYKLLGLKYEANSIDDLPQLLCICRPKNIVLAGKWQKFDAKWQSSTKLLQKGPGYKVFVQI